uniref:Uncharacterized protein n=1 Tax=Homalodisca liturata TaxID=320908 RepID=A0A1B6HTG9_9HEMI
MILFGTTVNTPVRLHRSTSQEEKYLESSNPSDNFVNRSSSFEESKIPLSNRSVPFTRSSSFENQVLNSSNKNAVHFHRSFSTEDPSYSLSSPPITPHQRQFTFEPRQSPSSHRHPPSLHRSISLEERAVRLQPIQSGRELSDQRGMSSGFLPMTVHRTTGSLPKASIYNRSISIDSSTTPGQRILGAVPPHLLQRRSSGAGLPPRRPLSSRRLSIF